MATYHVTIPLPPIPSIPCVSVADARVSGEDRAWWDRHLPASERWLEQRFPADTPAREMADWAADILVNTPMIRPIDGELPRNSWEGISAYEVLFEVLGINRDADWHPTLLAEQIRDLAAHFAQAGLIPAEIHARLDAEFELWIPRYHAWITRGTRYDADGTPHRPRTFPNWRSGKTKGPRKGKKTRKAAQQRKKKGAKRGNRSR